MYDIRALLEASVKLMDGKSPLAQKLPMPFEMLKKLLLKKIEPTELGVLLREYGLM